MASIRGTNNRAEVLLRRALWARGWRYRTYVKRLPGSPDIVFARTKTAVFVDGDYWHGRALIERGIAGLREVFRGARQEYWIEKISRNVARDRRNTRDLRRLGWKVVRVWERDVLRDTPKVVSRVERVLRRGLEDL